MTTNPPPRPARTRLGVGTLSCALLMVVVGAKWTLVSRYGSDLAYWDQWDAEGLGVLVPWFEQQDFVRHLFEPHNEHRVVITKLQALGLTLAAGQWDARLECLANAVLHSVLAVAVWLVGRLWLARGFAAVAAGCAATRSGSALSPSAVASRIASAVWFVLVALYFGLPLAWENTISGFHSQQYWLLGLSFATIVTLPFARPWTAAWWSGVVAACLALLSMGSGFLAPAAAALIALVRSWAERQTGGKSPAGTSMHVWPTVGVCLVLVAIGLGTHVEREFHAHLKARSLLEFFTYIIRSLQWPMREAPWAALVFWAPWLLVTISLLRSLGRTRSVTSARVDLTIVGLGGWIFLQVVATAYARGANADYPASRYMDTLAFGALVNAGAILWIAGQRVLGPGDRAVGRYRCNVAAFTLLGVLWLVSAGMGLSSSLQRSLETDLPGMRRTFRESEAHVRTYLATGDSSELKGTLPYPGSAALMERLRHPALLERMPVSVRAPVDIGTFAAEGFVRNPVSQQAVATARHTGLAPRTSPLSAHPTWGSWSPEHGAGATGVWRSNPLEPGLHGWLRFETAGDLGAREAAVSLTLRDAATDEVLASVTPAKSSKADWRAAYVKVPNRPWVLVADDKDPQCWFAFSAPVPMSTLSYIGWQCAKLGLPLMFAGLALAVAGWIMGFTSSFSRGSRGQARKPQRCST